MGEDAHEGRLRKPDICLDEAKRTENNCLGGGTPIGPLCLPHIVWGT